ncbi:MAG: DNA-directed RNA polymerase subunit beta [Myxococcales bacterium]|nr:DNA-directed RNA polymerase subunit beta [Myxococcales bacterium]
MPSVVQTNFRIRKNFASLTEPPRIPNLIEIQRQSYEKFLQANVDPDKREDHGLQGVFKSVFPIRDFQGTAALEFVSYHLEKPKYDVDECHQRGMTYAAPIKVMIRLVAWDKDEATGTQIIKAIKEQEVYFGEIPLMTENGTFIINGTERVIVSQLHRSPGAFFDHDRGKTHSSGKYLYSARIIPYRGSWIDFEFDPRDVLHVRIDRRRKLPATALLRALGYTTQGLLDYYYDHETVIREGDVYYKSVNLDLLLGQRAARELKDPASGEVIVRKNRKFTQAIVRKIEKLGITRIPVEPEELHGSVVAGDIIDESTGEVVAECNDDVTPDLLDMLRQVGISEFKILFIDNLNVGPYLRNTINAELNERRKAAGDGSVADSPEEAIMEIYRRLRPGEPPTEDTARNLFNNLFFNPERYDLSRVGRLKLNFKFGLDEPLETTVLTKRDILEVVRYLIELKNGKGQIDDIDHLGNRRVRAVGELLENQYRIGLVRMERAIKERMTVQETETLMPHDLINAKPVSAVVKEFFGSSQLSQFMDQTNPLSEVTHKRRLSALGPGGLTRERAGFEVRDVHPTHYGRICPIETPEGPNIGLISSLSTYARVNPYGFVETPYREVHDGKVDMAPKFHSALEEESQVIAQANAKVDEEGRFVNDLISVRRGGDFVMVRPDEVTLMDVSPNQLVSVAAALIPFLENDDANRALMGSNMQRQAVPLVRTDAPLVGTGMEAVVARDSGVTVVAKRDGVVEQVDATRIVVRVDTSRGVDRRRCRGRHLHAPQISALEPEHVHQPKADRSGRRSRAGRRRHRRRPVDRDGRARARAQLRRRVHALARLQLRRLDPDLRARGEGGHLHLDPHRGVRVHRTGYEARAGGDHPGHSERRRRSAEGPRRVGHHRIGAEVHAGDILVGKITPKGETQLSPEEKLLRAIFGEKAGDVRDTSLRVPTGVVGTVINAKVFSRKGVDKDERAQQIEDEEEARLLKDQNDEIRIIRDSGRRKMLKLLVGKSTSNRLVDDKGKELLRKSQELDEESLREVPEKYWPEVKVGEDTTEQRVRKVAESVRDQTELVTAVFQEKISRLKKGDELPPGVIKMVKVYVAIKRKLQPGDKMAGRHGNKGVISRVLPEEDMPFDADGTPVDVVLNPLGVPSRMNVGQILETHLGWAAHGVGKRLGELYDQWVDRQRDTAPEIRELVKKTFHDPKHRAMVDELPHEELFKLARRLRSGIHTSTPVFDGARETDIRELLGHSGRTIQSILFDGRTGEAFDQDVTVGVMYMLKLHHLVDDKIHARSIGPYSLVTQQPLGGKAQFGGQRLGEMEVWAMEAYGAAYSLQEFLTVKSDDVLGRTRMYEAIVKGENLLEAGLPESFNVLMKELQSLGLDVELLDEPEVKEIIQRRDAVRFRPVTPARKTEEDIEAEAAGGEG